MNKAESKIKTLEELIKIVHDLKEQGKRIVFTNGCFDVLHPGHIYLLEQAKSFGDILIVGLNSDESVRKIKEPPRPISSENDRAMVVASMIYTDYVIFFPETEPSNIISLLKPHIHVKGGDYNPNDIQNMPEASVVEKYGGEIKIVKLLPGYSTTKLIEKLDS